MLNKQHHQSHSNDLELSTLRPQELLDPSYVRSPARCGHRLREKPLCSFGDLSDSDSDENDNDSMNWSNASTMSICCDYEPDFEEFHLHTTAAPKSSMRKPTRNTFSPVAQLLGQCDSQDLYDEDMVPRPSVSGDSYSYQRGMESKTQTDIHRNISTILEGVEGAMSHSAGNSELSLKEVSSKSEDKVRDECTHGLMIDYEDGNGLRMEDEEVQRIDGEYKDFRSTINHNKVSPLKESATGSNGSDDLVGDKASSMTSIDKGDTRGGTSDSCHEHRDHEPNFHSGNNNLSQSSNGDESPDGCSRLSHGFSHEMPRMRESNSNSLISSEDMKTVEDPSHSVSPTKPVPPPPSQEGSRPTSRRYKLSIAVNANSAPDSHVPNLNEITHHEGAVPPTRLSSYCPPYTKSPLNSSASSSPSSSRRGSKNIFGLCKKGVKEEPSSPVFAASAADVDDSHSGITSSNDIERITSSSKDMDAIEESRRACSVTPNGSSNGVEMSPPPSRRITRTLHMASSLILSPLRTAKVFFDEVTESLYNRTLGEEMLKSRSGGRTTGAEKNTCSPKSKSTGLNTGNGFSGGDIDSSASNSVSNDPRPSASTDDALQVDTPSNTGCPSDSNIDFRLNNHHQNSVEGPPYSNFSSGDTKEISAAVSSIAQMFSPPHISISQRRPSITFRDRRHSYSLADDQTTETDGDRSASNKIQLASLRQEEAPPTHALTANNFDGQNSHFLAHVKDANSGNSYHVLSMGGSGTDGSATEDKGEMSDQATMNTAAEINASASVEIRTEPRTYVDPQGTQGGTLPLDIPLSAAHCQGEDTPLSADHSSSSVNTENLINLHAPAPRTAVRRNSYNQGRTWLLLGDKKRRKSVAGIKQSRPSSKRSSHVDTLPILAAEPKKRVSFSETDQMKAVSILSCVSRDLDIIEEETRSRANSGNPIPRPENFLSLTKKAVTEADDGSTSLPSSTTEQGKSVSFNAESDTRRHPSEDASVHVEPATATRPPSRTASRAKSRSKSRAQSPHEPGRTRRSSVAFRNSFMKRNDGSEFEMLIKPHVLEEMINANKAVPVTVASGTENDLSPKSDFIQISEEFDKVQCLARGFSRRSVANKIDKETKKDRKAIENEFMLFDTIIYALATYKKREKERSAIEEISNVVYNIVVGKNNYGLVALRTVGPASPRITVAFRGTHTLQDMVTDISLFPSQLSNTLGIEGHIHMGFKKRYLSLRDELQRLVWNCITQADIDVEDPKSTIKILFTGHSLGGAVANLAALDFKVNFGFQNIYCVSFSAPMIFGKKVCQLYNSLLRERSFRLVVQGDFIPSAFSFNSWYQHVDQLIAIKPKEDLDQSNNKHFGLFNPHMMDHYLQRGQENLFMRSSVHSNSSNSIKRNHMIKEENRFANVL